VIHIKIKSDNKLLLKLYNKFNVYILIIIAIVIIVVTSGIFASTVSRKPFEENNNIGEDFVFISLDGSKNKLSDYRGKIVILDMWATWCQPCQYQMVELERIYKEYSREKLEILSIDIDTNENVNQIQGFIDQFNKYGYELNWIFGIEYDSLNKYMPDGKIPALCIFDKKGNIYYSEVGYHDYLSLTSKIEELI
jgi:thiol-disulfide isomerase/thioredoxin